MIDILALRQSYVKSEIDEIWWICSENNSVDAMTKASPISKLEEIISINKAGIGLEEWIKR